MKMFLFPWMISLKNQFTMSFGTPSLGVNWMWTKRNDRAKWMCWFFLFDLWLKRAIFWENSSMTIFCLLLSSPTLPQKHTHPKCNITILLCHGPLSFFLTRAILLPIHRKTYWTMSKGNVDLWMCLLGNHHRHYDIFFPWCKPKWSWDEFNI